MRSQNQQLNGENAGQSGLCGRAELGMRAKSSDGMIGRALFRAIVLRLRTFRIGSKLPVPSTSRYAS